MKKDRDSWCIKNTFQSVCVAKVDRPEKCRNFVALCHHGSQHLFLSLAPPTVQACPPMCINISTESMCYDHMSSGTTRMDSVGALWLGDLVDRVFAPLEPWDSSCGKNPSREGAPWLWQWYDYDYDYDSIEVVLIIPLLLYFYFLFYFLVVCTVWYDTIRSDTIWYDTIRYYTVRYDTRLYCTMLYCTILHCTIHHEEKCDKCSSFVLLGSFTNRQTERERERERDRESWTGRRDQHQISKFYDHFQNPSISMCQHSNFTERLLKSKQNQGSNKAADASKREA